MRRADNLTVFLGPLRPVQRLLYLQTFRNWYSWNRLSRDCCTFKRSGIGTAGIACPGIAVPSNVQELVQLESPVQGLLYLLSPPPGGGIFKLSGIGTTGIAALWNVTPEIRTWQDVERGTTLG